jgi:SAM-dependent methyltransferase
LQPRLPRFRFHLAGEGHAPGQNPSGIKSAAEFRFPYPSGSFDLVILSSVLTHILPEAIENYVRGTARVLQPGVAAFMSVFLFDEAAANAVNSQTTIFDFRYRVGPCLTFDPVHPDKGIACDEPWLLEEVYRAGLHLNTVRRGIWCEVRSHLITQDYVVRPRVDSAAALVRCWTSYRSHALVGTAAKVTAATSTVECPATFIDRSVDEGLLRSSALPPRPRPDSPPFCKWFFVHLSRFFSSRFECKKGVM